MAAASRNTASTTNARFTLPSRFTDLRAPASWGRTRYSITTTITRASATRRRLWERREAIVTTLAAAPLGRGDVGHDPEVVAGERARHRPIARDGGGLDPPRAVLTAPAHEDVVDAAVGLVLGRRERVAVVPRPARARRAGDAPRVLEVG